MGVVRKLARAFLRGWNVVRARGASCLQTGLYIYKRLIFWGFAPKVKRKKMSGTSANIISMKWRGM